MKPGLTKQQVRVFKARLLKLADFLQTVKPSRFDMGSWVGEDWKGDLTLSCGTSACALGWATTIPSFRRLGLYLKRTGPDAWWPGGNIALRDPRTGRTTCDGEKVAAKVFGLDRYEVWDLFMGEQMTPRKKSQQIRKLVKELGADGIAALDAEEKS
jgi:hypothetical protein